MANIACSKHAQACMGRACSLNCTYIRYRWTMYDSKKEAYMESESKK